MLDFTLHNISKRALQAVQRQSKSQGNFALQSASQSQKPLQKQSQSSASKADDLPEQMITQKPSAQDAHEERDNAGLPASRCSPMLYQPGKMKQCVIKILSLQ